MVMRKLLFLLIFLSTPIWAQTAPTWSGGIGDESLEEMRAKQTEFNLKFVFTMIEGDFVADVAVKIADAKGQVVLEKTSEGPVLMTKLPAGNYVATLTYDGVAQTRKFALGARGLRTEQLRWKRSAADGPPML
jgi:hypothetical protein